MLVLHGLWTRGSLTVWGEDSTKPARTPSRAAIRVHPYAAAEADLRKAIARITGDTLSDTALDTAEAAEADLLLPGSLRHPLPSPDLGPLNDTPIVRSLELRTWRLQMLHIPADAVPALLNALRQPPDGGIAIGPGLHHIAAVNGFAERLAATGRLLPLTVGDPPEARWRPVLSGSDAEHFTALVNALPPPARAHLPADGTEGAGETVFSALCSLLDTAARTRLGTRFSGHRRTPLVQALTGPDAGVRADPGLSQGLRTWHRHVQHLGDRARLLFRLIEPEHDTEENGQEQAPATRSRARAAPEAWRVEFWVQSSTDPSLQLAVRDLWLGEGRAWLPRDVESSVLHDLTRAARHYPEIHRALNEPAPSSITMSTGGASVFIGDTAPRLSRAGFAVVLPDWAGRQTISLQLTTREQQSGGSGIGSDDLLDFSFDAVLNGEGLDLDELAELARLKQPLVRLRGRWVEVDPAHVRTALDFLRRRGSGTMRRGEALRMLMAADTGTIPPVDSIDADGALGALLSGTAEQQIAPMSTPADFETRLRPYQERGAAWLRFLGRLGLGAILADDMGLGKTVQLLALLIDEKTAQYTGDPGESRGTGEHRRAAPAAPTLLICPVSLVGNWQREAARFAPGLHVHVHHGPDRPHANALARTAGTSDLVITTYGVVLRDADELAAMPWHRVVCDEAQAIKNSGTRQARAVRDLPADSRIALTGTPVENNLGELWSIMEFTNPGLLGSAADFQSSIADQVERAAAEGQGTESADLLKRLTGPFILRRVKTDRSIISDLPEKQEMRSWCTLTPEQASLYKAAVDDMAEQLDGADGIQRKGLVLATMARLKQICNHPAQFLGDGSALAGRSGKLERLEDVLQEAVAEGDKVLCFTQYTAFGDRLAPYLAARLGREVLWLHGGTSRSRREEMVRHFHSSAEPMVFLLSLKAAGTGLNLTAANHVVHIDRWWNPAVEDQATDRAFRIGQRRDVQVRKLVCLGTLEERVDEMIERKKALAHSAVDTGEEWLTELSTEQLREVVRLAPEAVAR